MAKFINIEPQCELKSLEVYEDDGEFFLKAIYIYENDIGVYEVTIPRIKTGFLRWHPPVLEEHEEPPYHYRMGMTTTTLVANGYRYDVALYRGDNRQPNGYYWLKKELSKKVREMTIEDIEKQLGYPVKIVREKKKK